MERYKPNLLWLKGGRWNTHAVWILCSDMGNLHVSKRRLRRERGRLIRNSKKGK